MNMHDIIDDMVLNNLELIEAMKGHDMERLDALLDTQRDLVKQFGRLVGVDTVAIEDFLRRRVA